MKKALANMALQAAVPVIEWLAKHAERKVEELLAARRAGSKPK